jgi:hypothetical protein
MTRRGAKVVVVNMDSGELGSASSLEVEDFWFQGDAAVLLPRMLEPVVGDLMRYKGEAAGLKEEVEGGDEDDGEMSDEEEKDEVQRYFEASPSP